MLREVTARLHVSAEVLLTALQATGLWSLFFCRPLFRVLKLTGGFTYLATMSSQALARNDADTTVRSVLPVLGSCSPRLL